MYMLNTEHTVEFNKTKFIVNIQKYYTKIIDRLNKEPFSSEWKLFLWALVHSELSTNFPTVPPVLCSFAIRISPATLLILSYWRVIGVHRSLLPPHGLQLIILLFLGLSVILITWSTQFYLRSYFSSSLNLEMRQRLVNFCVWSVLL